MEGVTRVERAGSGSKLSDRRPKRPVLGRRRNPGKLAAAARETAVEAIRDLVIISAITALSAWHGGRVSFCLPARGPMVANISLLACALVTAQAADPAEWTLQPRLSRGQELVYRGSYTEEATGPGVQFNRTYRLESRVFVLESLTRGVDVAFLTLLKSRASKSDAAPSSEPNSVRLELARIDGQGRMTPASGASLPVPLDGPATIECEAFVELPTGRLVPNQHWETADGKRPRRTWKVVGTEIINGSRCVKLEGWQQSEDWDRPRADHTAWRRHDVVWMTPTLGVAYKVERTFERRDPAHRKPTSRSLTTFEFQSSIQYPGRLYDDRRREIVEARHLQELTTPLLPNPTQQNPRAFEVILAKVSHHVESQPATPYRDAVLQVKRLVQAAQRGESPPAPPAEDDDLWPTEAGLTVGRKAPDFVTTNLLTKESATLSRWQGKPLLMVFYTPTSVTVSKLLQFAQEVQQRMGDRVAVAGFVIADDLDKVRKQREELQISLPLYSGKGLRLNYSVDATPKLIVVDGDGIVRGTFTGWGLETAAAVDAELQQWLRRDRAARTDGSLPPVRPTSRPVRRE